MSIIRCPQCNLPATREESASGLCPDCGAELPLPAQEPVKVRELPAATWHLHGFFLSVAALMILLIGVGVGYCVGAFAPHDKVEMPPTELATSTSELEAALKRAKDAEEKGRRDVEERKKQTLSADEARKQQDDAIKELGLQAEKLTQDVHAQKKLTAEATARAEAAEKEAAAARVEGGGGPLNVRVKQLDALVKQQKAALDAQVKLTRDATVRADGLQRMVELVRQQGQQMTEMVRQQGQRSLEQLRQENQRQIEQVRAELRKQQQLTDQARNEATKQKLAADELRRKTKAEK